MATRTYPRLQLNSGSTYNIPAGDTIIVLEYVDGDWDNTTITSTGTWYLKMPAAGVSVSNLNITNCDASGGGTIDATNGGIDGGGNTNISFGVAIKSVPSTRYSYIRAATLDSFLFPNPSGVLVGTAGNVEIFSQGIRVIYPVRAGIPESVCFSKMFSENTTAASIFFLYQ